MPDDKPSSAPDNGLAPKDDLTAAAVLNDDDNAPGGGGLMGAGAANAATTPSTGGTAPNAPIDVPTPQRGAAEDGEAEGESVAAAAEQAQEPKPASQ